MKKNIIPFILGILLVFSTTLLTFSLTGCSNDSITTETTSVNSGTITETESSTSQPGNPGTPPGGFGSGSSANGVAMAPPGSGTSDANVVIQASSTGLSASGTTEKKTSGTYTSITVDESAVVASNGGTITLSNATITKSGDVTNTENSEFYEFYGLNSGLIAKDKSTITLSDSTVTTTAKGANGVFSTSNSTVNLSNVTIKTTATTGARGIDATYGATINADKITVSTVGAHSAATATDRGEGFINVSNSTLETSGTDSPAFYSTGDFKIKNTTATATAAEAAVIEGQNSITLTDCILTGMKNWGVMIYQSFSGDADGDGGIFTMEGGSLTANEGPLFYSANTTGFINLKNVTLKNISGILVKAAANSRWGTTGSNGSTLTLTADTQKLEGNIIADSISSVTSILKNSSSFIGALDTENIAKGMNLTLDETSTWTVTADSHIDTLSGAIISGTTVKNIIGNGHNVYYKSSVNSSLEGKTYTLTDGGQLIAE